MTQGTVPFKYSLPAACSTICCCLSSFLLNGFTLKQNCSHCWTQSGQVSTPPSTEPAACHGFPTSIFLAGHQLPRPHCICQEVHFSSLARHSQRAGWSASHFAQDALRDSRQTLERATIWPGLCWSRKGRGEKAEQKAHLSAWLLSSALGHCGRAGGASGRSPVRTGGAASAAAGGGRAEPPLGGTRRDPAGSLARSWPQPCPAGTLGPGGPRTKGPEALVRSQRRSFPRHLRGKHTALGATFTILLRAGLAGLGADS